MMHYLPKIMTVLALAFVLVGCGDSCPEKRIPPPEKLHILSLVTAADHILSELGAADKIAAIDRHGKVLDSMQNTPVAVAGGMVSREMLKKYRINFAVIWYYQKHLTEIFRKEGIPYLIVDPIGLENYPELVRKLGKVTGKTVDAESCVQKFTRVFAALPKSSIPGKSVYVELYAPWKSPAADGYIGQIVQSAGGSMACSSKRGGTVSPEAVAMANPDVIFFVENSGSVQEIARRTALAHTPAVKNKRIYAIPRKLVCEGVAPIELLNFLSDKIKDF